MGRIIAITNQKGGVGKTTSAVNLAATLTAEGKSVLLIDMDPQGNATMGCGVNKQALELGTVDVLLQQATVAEALVVLENTLGFSVLPSNGDLTAAEVGLMKAKQREKVLSRALAEAKGQFDYIIIDCPPALNMLTLNALSAADGVLIPMQCEYYALEGLSALLSTMDKVRQAVNPRLRIDGILRTMFDPRNNLSVDVSEQLEEHFGAALYATIVPRNVRLAEAPSHGLPVSHYDKSSTGAKAYKALAAEMIERHAA